MATRRNWRPLWIALRFLVSGGLLAVLIWRANPASLWTQWERANLALLVLAALLQALCICISALKWRTLLRANQQPQPYLWLLAVNFVGQFANNFLPTSVGGDAMRVVALGRRTGSYAQASASVFMERLTGFLALSLIAIVALLVTSTDLFGMRLVTAPTLTLTAGAFALLAAVAAVTALASPWLLPRVSRFLPAVVYRPLARVATTLGEYRDSPGTVAAVMGLSLLFHTSWISMHLACGLALAIAAPPLIYTLMVPLTDILGLVPIFVNNVGARDLVFTIYLSQVGVPEATAIALAFTAFSVRLLVSAIGGLLLLFGGADLRGASGAEPDSASEAATSRRP